MKKRVNDCIVFVILCGIFFIFYYVFAKYGIGYHDFRAHAIFAGELTKLGSESIQSFIETTNNSHILAYPGWHICFLAAASVLAFINSVMGGIVSDLNIYALAVAIVNTLLLLCTFFTTLAGFFTAKFKMHPFISTMANMLMIFGLVTYATKGVSFGAIEPSIPAIIIPKVNGFPTIILWAVAAIVIVWFIWNKTTFGKNLYAVGGNPEAAAVSGISVFAVTVGAFVLAGILYGFGSWLECARMVGSGSAAYGQGWETDAIAACVVGGVSFTGGIGKISGVVVGVLIFTALTYSLTILGIDTNLQFVFSGIIILVAVTLDCLKYVQKK